MDLFSPDEFSAELISKLNNLNNSDPKNCPVCLKRVDSAVKLEDDIVALVISYIIFDNKGKEVINCPNLSVCKACEKLFLHCTDLFLQLEELKERLKDVRKQIAKKIILQTLQKSQEYFEQWKEKAENFEGETCTISLKKKTSCDLLLEKSNVIEDEKLRKMHAVVILERLDEIRKHTESSISFNLDVDVKDEFIMQSDDAFLEDINIPSIEEFHNPSDIIECDINSDEKLMSMEIEEPSETNSELPRDNMALDCYFIEDIKAEPVEEDLIVANDTSTNLIHDNEEEANASAKAKPFLCPECGKRFRDKFGLTRHLRVHKTAEEKSIEEVEIHDQNGQTEIISENIFGSGRQLRKRPARKQASEIVSEEPSSDECNASASESDSSSRSDDDEDIPTSVVSKPKRIRKRRSKKLPRISKTIENSLKKSKVVTSCKHCNKLVNKKSIIHHLKVFHDIYDEEISSDSEPDEIESASGKIFKCRKCASTFSAKYLLRRHLAEMHSEFRCHSCISVFKTNEEYTLHKKEKHKKTKPQKKKKCHLCPIFINSARSEKIHMVSVHGIQLGETRLPCTFCDLTFNEESLLALHKLYAHSHGSTEWGIVKCEFCLRFVRCKRNLIGHQKIVHFDNENPSPEKEPQNIKCFVCVDSPNFLTPEGLRIHEESKEHQSTIKSKISVYCHVCKKNFQGDAEALKVHIVGEDHLKEVQSLGDINRGKFCVPCRENFETFEELKRHEFASLEHKTICTEFMKTNQSEETSDGNSFICFACTKIFNDKKSLDRHVKQFHPPDGHTCKICKMKFQEWTEFTLHSSTHTKTEEKTCTCDKCGKSFARKKTLLMHIRTKHSEKSFKCDKCDNDKTFISKASYQQHVYTVHNGVVVRQDCPYCDAKLYDQTLSLRRHLCQKHPEEHLKEKPHFCNICYETFCKEEELTKHMESHNNLKCSVCGKICLSPGNLTSHMRVHTGERPFACSMCDAKFKNNGNLKNHVQAVHEKKKRNEKKE